MELYRDSATTHVGPPGTQRLLAWSLALLSLLPLCVVIPMAPTKAGIAVVAGWIALIWITISFVRCQLHYVVLMWIAVYPYCYYLLSYPAERSIFTIDRALTILLIIDMCVVSSSAAAISLTRDVRISAYLWALYLVLCFVSLASHSPTKVLPSYRLLVDGMLMPALFGLYAICYFPLLKNLQKLHTSACILAVGLCITGLIELIMGIDLFPWSGSAPVFTDSNLRRADGPFEQQIVLSIVTLITFFFIIYLRRLMPERISPWRAVLHTTGSMAAMVAALLPMNRGLILALVPIALVDSCSKNHLIPRRAWAALFAVLVLAVIAARLLDPQLYDDRVSNPNNAYQRVAQHQETLRVVREYPMFGVGFGLYYDVAASDPRYQTRWNGIESMNAPHNVVMTVLAEQGVAGLICYIAAQVFFIRAMWKIRKVYPPGWLAFLYCILVYVLIGLDFATVYFSDINLFYIFVLGVLYQMQARMAHKEELALWNQTAQVL